MSPWLTQNLSDSSDSSEDTTPETPWRTHLLEEIPIGYAGWSTKEPAALQTAEVTCSLRIPHCSPLSRTLAEFNRLPQKPNLDLRLPPQLSSQALAELTAVLHTVTQLIKKNPTHYAREYSRAVIGWQDGVVSFFFEPAFP